MLQSELHLKSQKKTYKRRQYYILPKFQNHFMMIAVFQALMICGALIYPEHRMLTAYIDKIESQRQELAATPTTPAPVGSEAATSLDASLLEQNVQELTLLRNTTTLYATFFIFLTCVIFGFYCSHRLGGPIFKTLRYLREYQEGKELPPLSFREGDFFHELADEVNVVLKTRDKTVSK